MTIGEGAVWALNPEHRQAAADRSQDELGREADTGRSLRRGRCRRWVDLADEPGREHGRSDGARRPFAWARRSTSGSTRWGSPSRRVPCGSPTTASRSRYPERQPHRPGEQQGRGDDPARADECLLRAAHGRDRRQAERSGSSFRKEHGRSMDPETIRRRLQARLSALRVLDADESTVWSTGGACADVVGRIDVRTHGLRKLVEPHPIGLKLAFGHVWVASLAAATSTRSIGGPIRSWRGFRSAAFQSISQLVSARSGCSTAAVAFSASSRRASARRGTSGLSLDRTRPQGNPSCAARSPLLRSRCHAPRSRRET